MTQGYVDQICQMSIYNLLLFNELYFFKYFILMFLLIFLGVFVICWLPFFINAIGKFLIALSKY